MITCQPGPSLSLNGSITGNSWSDSVMRVLCAGKPRTASRIKLRNNQAAAFVRAARMGKIAFAIARRLTGVDALAAPPQPHTEAITDSGKGDLDHVRQGKECCLGPADENAENEGGEDNGTGVTQRPLRRRLHQGG